MMAFLSQRLFKLEIQTLWYPRWVCPSITALVYKIASTITTNMKTWWQWVHQSQHLVLKIRGPSPISMMVQFQRISILRWARVIKRFWLEAMQSQKRATISSKFQLTFKASTQWVELLKWSFTNVTRHSEKKTATVLLILRYKVNSISSQWLSLQITEKYR